MRTIYAKAAIKPGDKEGAEKLNGLLAEKILDEVRK